MLRQASLWVVAGRRLLLGLLLFGLSVGESRAQPSAPEIASPAAVDHFGDALPEGVVRRFGSLRFRHAAGYKAISSWRFRLTVSGSRLWVRIIRFVCGISTAES